MTRPGAEGNTFLLSLVLGFKQKVKQTADSMGNVFVGQRFKMCSHPHSLTLRGESVFECAEFLFTTLLTFSLFGILILKG